MEFTNVSSVNPESLFKSLISISPGFESVIEPSILKLEPSQLNLFPSENILDEPDAKSRMVYHHHCKNHYQRKFLN